MPRYITTLTFGKEIKYFDKPCIVRDFYSHIAYLEDLKSGEIMCVCLGDLVMAGVEPSMPFYIPKVK